MRLVGDHELVGLAADAAVVAREPGVGLDGDRVRLRRRLALFDHRGQPVAVALGRQLAVELRDEQPAVREDEDAHRARGLDEPGRGDRLARRRGVAEAITADCARILFGRKLLGKRLLVLVDEVDVLELLVLELDLAIRVPVAVHGLLGPLVRGDQLGEHPRQGVDLVAAELGAGSQGGGLLGQHSLEAEHQSEANLPLRRRLAAACLDLGARLVEGVTPSGALGRTSAGSSPL